MWIFYAIFVSVPSYNLCYYVYNCIQLCIYIHVYACEILTYSLMQTPSKPADFEQMQSSPAKPLAKIDFDTGGPKRKGRMESATYLYLYNIGNFEL